jgi:histone H3/H4
MFSACPIMMNTISDTAKNDQSPWLIVARTLSKYANSAARTTIMQPNAQIAMRIRYFMVS